MSDLIDRQAAIEALERDMASLDHIIKGMSANDVRLDAYVSQRNQVNYDIYTINNLPPVQPEQLGTNLAEVDTDCISRQAAIDAVYKCNDIFVGDMPVMVVKADAYEALAQLPPIQPKRGKWFYQNGMIKCDQCLRAIRRIDHDGILNFCPNCGVDMRGEQE